jgi:hypothetical protein
MLAESWEDSPIRNFTYNIYVCSSLRKLQFKGDIFFVCLSFFPFSTSLSWNFCVVCRWWSHVRFICINLFLLIQSSQHRTGYISAFTIKHVEVNHLKEIWADVKSGISTLNSKDATSVGLDRKVFISPWWTFLFLTRIMELFTEESFRNKFVNNIRINGIFSYLITNTLVFIRF